MVQLGGSGIKILKILHILFAVMWIGGVMALVSLMLGARPGTPEEIYMAARTHYVIDVFFLIPGGLGIVASAFAYALMTKWGFFKHRWITVKWVLTLLLIVVGAGYMGHLIKVNVHIADGILDGVESPERFFGNVRGVAIAGIAQIVGFIYVIAISVIKPWTHKAGGGSGHIQT